MNERHICFYSHNNMFLSFLVKITNQKSEFEYMCRKDGVTCKNDKILTSCIFFSTGAGSCVLLLYLFLDENASVPW